jgi:trafficking protein particle complex subunit 2
MVGRNDNPLYESEWHSGGGNAGALSSSRKDGQGAHLNEFIIHSALDLVDDLVWKTNQCYLKTVDNFKHQYISAYVTPGSMLFDTRFL